LQAVFAYSDAPAFSNTRRCGSNIHHINEFPSGTEIPQKDRRLQSDGAEAEFSHIGRRQVVVQEYAGETCALCPTGAGAHAFLDFGIAVLDRMQS
jgi:hypothetical protein